jgi:hypothetical protein
MALRAPHAALVCQDGVELHPGDEFIQDYYLAGNSGYQGGKFAPIRAHRLGYRQVASIITAVGQTYDGTWNGEPIHIGDERSVDLEEYVIKIIPESVNE